jgi:hypothetical protein
MDLNSKTVAPKKICSLPYNARTTPPSRITATPPRCFPDPMDRLKKRGDSPSTTAAPAHRRPRPRPTAEPLSRCADQVTQLDQNNLSKKNFFRSLRSLNRYDKKPMHLTVATVDTEGRLAGV